MEASTSVNAPHVNDTGDANAAPDPEDFFGDDDETTHAEEATEEVAARPAAETAKEGDHIAAGAPVEPETPAGVESLAPETPAPGVPDTATAAGRAAAAAAPAPPAPAATTTEPPAEDPPPADPPAEEPQANKTKERPYKVFRELKLDESTLTKLLEHVKGGADPIDVYLEVETVEARNDTHALRQVYAGHRERIGERPRLVPVSERAWRPKTVQPRQRVEEALEIT